MPAFLIGGPPCEVPCLRSLWCCCLPGRRDSSALLLWLTAPTGCGIDATLPAGASITRFDFPDSARTATGVHARLLLDACSDVHWGALTEAGSSLHLSDTELLACGLMFRGGTPGTVTNLSNGGGAMTKSFDFTDRSMSLTRSAVQVWNLYPSDRARVSVSNSVFGELLCMGHAEAVITNSICDGSGGFVGANDSSKLTATQCMISTDVIGRNRGGIVLVGCSVPAGTITAADNATLAVLNSTYQTMPHAAPGAAVLIGSIDEPGSGTIGSTIPVYGTAKLVAGAMVPVTLDASLLDVSPDGAAEKTMRISEHRPGEVYRGVLGQWDTRALAAGPYLFRLALLLSSGDTIAVTKRVQLFDAPVGIRPATPGTAGMALSIAPNPVARGVGEAVLSIRGNEGQEAVVRVCDLLGREALGSRSITLATVSQRVPMATRGLLPGTYMVIVQTGTQRAARMLTVSP